jgi:GR25 family glycosyltransferase involved in LPS biosynthesis
MSFDCFDRVYCVHLPNPERRGAIQQQFARVGIKDVTYIHAKPPAPGFTMSNMRRGPRGEFGCNLSHIKAAMHAVADGAERPLFFEDDVIFSDDAVDRMRSVASELSAFYWDILYLGGHPRGACHRVTDNLAEISAFSFAESYAIPAESLVSWLDFWCDNIGQKNAMVDIQLGRWALENNGFAVYPTITHQPDGISQISGQHDCKDKCIRNGWRNNLCTTDRPCKECADWLIRSA